MDRLDAMRVFVAIADAGSITAAARTLRAPLATVSRKLASLEDHLGARLITRTTRRLALTDTGRGYLDACRRVLVEVDDAERAAAGEHASPRGRLEITAPVAFGRMHVLPIVTELLTAHPGLDVRMLLVDRVVNLVEEGIDAAVRIGAQGDSSAIATRVGEVRYVCVASKPYLAAHGAPRTPGDLARHACVMFASTAAGTHWTFRRRAIAIHARLAVNTADAAIDAVLTGLGITRVLSYQAAAHVAAGRLRVVLADHEDPPLPVAIVHPAARLAPARLRAFVDFAAPRLRERLR